MSRTSDVIVVGAGHNGLTCAAYLAEAGLEVVVLEARSFIGGNTATEELTLPGWRHDSCSSAHVVIQSNPLISRDELGLLERYGLEYIVSDPAVVFPNAGEDSLVFHPDLERTRERVARYSPSDATALVEMVSEWEEGLRTVHAYVQSGLPASDDEWARRYEELRRRSAREVIEEKFTHPVVRRAITWLAFATIQSPIRPGTGVLPASIVTGRIRFGWTTPRGGSEALPRALERHLVDHGGEVVLDASVAQYLREGDRCVGVRTVDGREFFARRAVVAGSHLRRLADQMDEPSADLLRAKETWRPGLSVFAVHFALREHPTYRVDGEWRPAVAAGLGSPEGLHTQVAAAERGEVDLTSPWLLMVDSTVVDPSRAPGAAYKFLTIAPERVDGHEWTASDAEHYADQLVEFARPHVRGLEEENILARVVESPTSLAAHSPANVGGSCHGGEFHDEGQILPGWLSPRAGVAGLYLTGSTSHPGGSVSGRPGRNAARAVLEDLGPGGREVMARP